MQLILFFFNSIFIKGGIETFNRVFKNCPVMRNLSLIVKYEIGKQFIEEPVMQKTVSLKLGWQVVHRPRVCL